MQIEMKIAPTAWLVWHFPTTSSSSNSNGIVGQMLSLRSRGKAESNIRCLLWQRVVGILSITGHSAGTLILAKFTSSAYLFLEHT